MCTCRRKKWNSPALKRQVLDCSSYLTSFQWFLSEVSAIYPNMFTMLYMAILQNLGVWESATPAESNPIIGDLGFPSPGLMFCWSVSSSMCFFMFLSFKNKAHQPSVNQVYTAKFHSADCNSKTRSNRSLSVVNPKNLVTIHNSPTLFFDMMQNHPQRVH